MYNYIDYDKDMADASAYEEYKEKFINDFMEEYISDGDLWDAVGIADCAPESLNLMWIEIKRNNFENVKIQVKKIMNEAANHYANLEFNKIFETK